MPNPRFLVPFSFLFINASLFAQAPSASPAESAGYGQNARASNLKATIINVPNHRFGYDIYLDGRLIIHQPSIPALPSNEGFVTKADAETVARLIIYKISKSPMPPTVTTSELRHLQVIK